MKYLTIRKKLIILTLITLIPLIVLQGINIYNDFQRSTEQKLQSSEELANAVSKSFVNHIEEIWAQELIMSKEINSKVNDKKAIQEYLQQIVNTDETTMQRLSFVNSNGIIIASTNKNVIGKSVVETGHYKRMINGEEKILSNIIEGYDNGDIVFPVARTVRKDGQLVGMIVAIVDVNKLVSKIPSINLNEGDLVGIIDSNAYLVYNSQKVNMSLEERKIPQSSSIMKALKGEIVNNYKSFDDGTYRMGVYYPIKEFGWALFVTSKLNVVLKDTYRQAANSIITLIAVSILSLIGSYIFGLRIAKPLIILKEKADELKKGNYAVRTDIIGFDEVAVTAEAFDHMADSIQEYDKIKSQFFVNLSHEIKTPINVIFSSVQLMESYNKNWENNNNHNNYNKNIKIIKQNCYRLMRLVSNLIDVTKYDSNYFNVNLKNSDIVTLIEDISLSVVKYAEQKNISIIFDTDIEEKIIACDPDLIERIVLNLISNSLKFTNEDGFIYVNFFDGNDKISFSVKDTGIGIPENKINIIFDRFRQIDNSLNRKQEGSGIGLSLVKAFVEVHDGNITVKSEINKGTEFIIELPVNVLPQDNQNECRHEKNKFNETIEKIEVEFSDIYSVQKNNF